MGEKQQTLTFIAELPYVTQETLGRQFLSTMPSAGIATFGTSKRESMARKTGVPGPGAYKNNETTGKIQGARNGCKRMEKTQ